MQKPDAVMSTAEAVPVYYQSALDDWYYRDGKISVWKLAKNLLGAVVKENRDDLALHEKHGHIDSGEFARRVQAWLDSSLADTDANHGGAGDAASFIAGVTFAGRDILFTEPGFLAAIDRVVFALDDEKFLSVLPRFRQAFTALPPAETGRLGRMVAALHGLSDDDDGLHPEQVTREELALGMTLDKKAVAAMDYWGVEAALERGGPTPQ